MKRTISFVSISVLIFLLACEQQSNLTEQDYIDLKKTGAQVVQKASQALQGELNAAVKKDGLIGAIDYCNLHATGLTARIGDETGYPIARTSLKLRNPNNKPNEREKMLLNMYREASSQEELIGPTLDVYENGQIFYYAPIMINALCLNCHGQPGNELVESTFNALKAKYPNDKAMGYKLGEFRGVWRVKLK